jgi:uncharacterized protein DUF4124
MNDFTQARARWLALAALAASIAAGGASAQLFKCKGPDGKIVYSDRRCEASETASGVSGVKNRAHENEEKAAAEKAAAEKEAEKLRQEAEARIAAQRKLDAEMRKAAPADPAAPPPENAPAGPYAPTSAERERLRELEMTAGSSGAYAEQKSAARLHMQSIRQGRESRLSAEDRERRDSLTVDLSSTDAQKRARALRDLQSIYYR